eukprot:515946-Rhodomonas_salina.2
MEELLPKTEELLPKMEMRRLRGSPQGPDVRVWRLESASSSGRMGRSRPVGQYRTARRGGVGGYL